MRTGYFNIEHSVICIKINIVCNDSLKEKKKDVIGKSSRKYKHWLVAARKADDLVQRMLADRNNPTCTDSVSLLFNITNQ